MAGCKNHLAGTTYTCVDSHPDTLQGGSTYKGGKLVYPVEAHCGSLKCPPLCVPFVQKNKMLNFEKNHTNDFTDFCFDMFKGCNLSCIEELTA